MIIWNTETKINKHYKEKQSQKAEENLKFTKTGVKKGDY